MKINTDLSAPALFLTIASMIASCSFVDEPSKRRVVSDPPYQAIHSIDNLEQAKANLLPYPRSVNWLSGVYQGEEIHTTIKTLPFSDSDEAYRLVINESGVVIEANHQKGFIYAKATLNQLSDNNSHPYPFVEIEDFPAYKIRGVMHDVGRNFQSIDYLKAQLSQLAKFKINTFHWHLSDDPGWRIESKKYPQLNYEENYYSNRDPGKFYSYAEIVDLMLFAKSLNITVIPELDMPGHSEFFDKAFGFGMGSYRGRKICLELLQEFFDHVPQEIAPYIHLGSDEVFILFADHFIESIEAKALENNRIPIIWNPGLKAGDKTVVEVWGPGEFDSEKMTIDSSDFYTNTMDPFNSINRIYFKQVSGTKTGDDDFALGAILSTWNDVAVTDQSHVLRNNPFYLTALTAAEIWWNGNPTGNYQYQSEIPPKGTMAHTMFAEFEQRLLFFKDKYFDEKEFFYLSQSNVDWLVTADTGETKKVVGNTVMMKSRWTLEGVFPELPLGSWVTASKEIYAEEDKEVWLHVGFNLPHRSHRMSQGIPKQGQWDAFGGQVLLNGKAVKPPKWNEPGKFHRLDSTWHKPIQEQPWREEELYWLRKPVKISLKAGANTLTIKSQYGFNDQIWQISQYITPMK